MIQLDELTRSLARSVTRCAALKKIGVGLDGMAMACFGLANKAHAGTPLDVTMEAGGVDISLPSTTTGHRWWRALRAADKDFRLCQQPSGG